MSGIDGYTKLMLHCDGADESIIFTDASASGHTMTAQGNAQIDTAQKKFGSASGFFDGSGDYLTTPDSTDWAFGSSDFTIDAWVRFTDTGARNILVGRTTDANSYFYWQLKTGINGSRFADYNSGYNFDFETSPSFSINTWYHVAITRSGNDFRMFVDGTQVGSTYNNSNAFVTRTVTFDVGAMTQNSAYVMHGWIDELRISKGIARWISNFTPPTEAYTSVTNIDDTINVSDSWNISNTKQNININDTINVSDSWNISAYTPIHYPTEIISDGDYLYSVTYTNPAQIIKYDISIPGNPNKTVYDIIGQSSAINFSLNTSNDYFYVECDNGKIVKISKANLNNQTIISTGETEDFVIGESLNTYLKTFASTDNTNGEIVMIDEATIESLNTDVRWSKQMTFVVSCIANTSLGKTINLDIRYSKDISSTVSMDARWIKYDYDDISNYPIDYSDIQVIVNGTDISNTGVDLKSIVITHTKGTDSVASFTLYRKHDDLNNGCTITNNNTVVININGVEEFNGNVSSFIANSQSETVEISAVMDEPEDKRQNVTIPLSTINTHFHLYDCLIDSVSNNNNTNMFEGSEDTRVVLTNESGLYYRGQGLWSGDISDAHIYNSFQQANAQLTGDANLENFTSQDVWAINYKEPSYYKGIAVNLGTGIWNASTSRTSQSHSELYLEINEQKSLTEKLKDGKFTPDQNWEYFWFTAFEYFKLPNQEDRPYGDFMASISGLKYIGTSLGSLTTDLWEITNAKYIKQRRYGDTTYDLGWYYVGEAPYKIVSKKNGKKHCHHIYEDRADGLYDVWSEYYDYTQYAKDCAGLDNLKLKNINDEVLPRVSSTVNLTLNGYYYYGVKLLTRVNLSNTTSSNIYNNNNGFPVSIKSITLNTSTMQVSLKCNNELSHEEMEEIDKLYPDENSDEYYTPEHSFCNFNKKYDPNKWGYID